MSRATMDAPLRATAFFPLSDSTGGASATEQRVRCRAWGRPHRVGRRGWERRQGLARAVEDAARHARETRGADPVAPGGAAGDHLPQTDDIAGRSAGPARLGPGARAIGDERPAA